MQMLFNIIYALAASDGREEELFGSCAPLAQQSFARSFAGDEFPEIWFEIPLAGEPWFDLHVLTSRDALDDGKQLSHDRNLLHPELFEWFANQPDGVRQLALSHDLSAGRVDNPAVQLLVSTRNPNVTCSFLEEASGAGAARTYRAFVEHLPKGWFACYTGVFPGRPGMGLRVECIPDSDLQKRYACDADLIAEHLRQVGLDELGDTIVPRCQQFARMPFNIEFQFDVDADGSAGSTLGLSARFDAPPGSDGWDCFEADGAGGELMQMVESWGLADERWRLFAGATFAKSVSRGGERSLIFNFPAFVKLRWRDGHALDAKAYFMAGVQSG